MERLTLRISLKDARAQGLKHYFTGKPCKQGHRAKRRVDSYQCVECKRVSDRKWQQANPMTLRANSQRWQQANSEKYRAIQLRTHRNRYARDAQYRLACDLRQSLQYALRGKSKPALRDIGCSLEELRAHIEKQFYDGITWDNHGKHWVINHITPLSSFDLTDRQQYLQACNWSNLRPLTRTDFVSRRTARIREALAART